MANGAISLYTFICFSLSVGGNKCSSLHPVTCISAYQWCPAVLSNLWSRSSGVHVAEKVLDPSKGDTASLVTHLWIGDSVHTDVKREHR